MYHAKPFHVCIALLILLVIGGCASPTALPTTPPTALQPAAQPSPTVAATQPPAPTTAPTFTLLPPPTAKPTSLPGGVIPGGTLILGVNSEPGSFSDGTVIANALQALIVEGLVGTDPQGNFIPVLAETLPSISADGLTITYTLKPDIHFNNGDLFTCADVQFTMEAIMASFTPETALGYEGAHAECPDEYTAVIKSPRPASHYLSLFHTLTARASGDIADVDNWIQTRDPIGSGPYMVKEWKAGDYLELEKNPYYREAGKPYLDKIIVKFLSGKEASNLQLLSTGEIMLSPISISSLPAVEKMAGVSVAGVIPGSGFSTFLVFNLADPKVDAPADPAQAPHPILADLRVRQAIQLAIDKQLIVEALLYGKARVGMGVVPLGPYACPQPPSEYNPHKATDLLQAAGWVAGDDGIRQKDGLRLSLKLTGSGEAVSNTQQALAEMLKEVGVELIPEVVPSQTFFSSWKENNFRKHGQFDILIYSTGPGLDPNVHFLDNFHSTRSPTEKNKGLGLNLSRYINPDVDAWIMQAILSTNMEARRQLSCQIAAQVDQDLPRLYLYESPSLYAYRDELQNFQLSPGYSRFTYAAQNWWLKR
jgi:peptide/nickel transport system substrate-binding protein